LSAALSTSNIERSRVTAMSGDLRAAQGLIWAEFLRSGGSADGFSGTATGVHAYWALWDMFRQAPCVASLPFDGGDACETPFFADGGRSLCVVTRAGTLCRWSVPGWRPEAKAQIATAERGVPFRAAASRDGLTLALLGGGAARIADARTGRVLVNMADPEGTSVTAAFSPGGEHLATIGQDGRLRVRDAATLAVVWESPDPSVCEFSPDQVCQPAYTPDGSTIAAARPDGSLGLWDAATGVLTRALAPPDSAAPMVAIGMRPSRAAFAGDGSTVAASLGTHVVVWRGDALPADLRGHISNVAHVEFVPGNPDMLYSVGREGAALWDLQTSRRVRTFAAAENGMAAALSPDGRWIALGTKVLQVLEAAPEPYVSVLNRGEGPGGVVAISHSGRTVALARGRGGTQGQSVLLVDLESGSVQQEFAHPGTRVMDVAFSPDDASLYVCEIHARIVRWDLATGVQDRVYTFPGAPPGPDALVGENQMRLSPDGRTLASAFALEGGMVGLWAAERGAWMGAITERGGLPSSVDFSPDGTSLMIAWRTGVEFRDLQSRSVIRRVPGEGPLLVRFSPDGQTFVQTRQALNSNIRDVRTGRELTGGPLPGSARLTMAFHPSGRVVVGGAQDQSVRLWDAQTSTVLLSLKKHEAPIISVALSPDGRRLISSDLEGTTLVWDLAHYQEHINREWQSRDPVESR
jgi:WD40 repeat protein